MIPNVVYSGFTPTYAGSPVDEYAKLQKGLADEYDIVRKKEDDMLAAIATVNPRDTAGMEYVKTVKDNINKSINSLAVDLQGGRRYEYGRGQIVDLYNKITLDPTLKVISDNAKRINEAEGIKAKLEAEGKTPLDFSQPDNFKSYEIGADGNVKYNYYQPEVQPRGDWNGAMQEIINKIKPKMENIFGQEAIGELGNYFKTGVRTYLTDTVYQTFGNEMLNAYLNSEEGKQHLRFLTQRNNRNQNPIGEAEAKELIKDDILGLASLGTFDYSKYNFDRDNTDIEKLKLASKMVGRSKAGNSLGDDLIEQISIRGNPGIETLSDRKIVDYNEKDYNEKGEHIDREETKTKISQANVQFGMYAGMDNGNTETIKHKASDKKVETEKRRKWFKAQNPNVAAQFDNVSDRVIDEAYANIMNEQRWIALDTMRGTPDLENKLKQMGIIKTKDTIPMNDSSFRVFGTGGDTKKLSDILGNKKPDNVSFKGFVMNANDKNANIGDLLYSVSVGDKSIDVYQSLSSFDSQLSDQLQPYKQLLKPLHDMSLDNPNNLRVKSGDAFDEKQFIDASIALPMPKGLVKFAPRKIFNGQLTSVNNKLTGSANSKLKYVLEPTFQYQGKYHYLTDNVLDKLYNADKSYNNGKYKPLDEETYLSMKKYLSYLKQFTNGKKYVDYEDIIQNARRTIFANPYFIQLVQSGKSKQDDISAIEDTNSPNELYD